MPNNVYGYVRVSTLDQAHSGHGLAAQRDAIERYVKWALEPKGYRLSRIYEDKAVSGKTELRSRRYGLELANTLEQGDVVVFAKLDRGFRNCRDCLNCLDAWTRRGVRVVFADLQIDTATPIGELLIKIMAAFAEWERHRIRERQVEAIAQRKLKGNLALGAVPYGFKKKTECLNGKKEKVLVPDPASREMGKRFLQWRQEGWTIEAIYYHLRRHKLERTPGREWTLSAIWKHSNAEAILQEREAQQRRGAPGENLGPPASP